MQPGNLVFLVLVGVWVAYFVHYWSRRREHLATARTRDRFSETMRVLHLADTELAAPGVSYAVRAPGPSPFHATKPAAREDAHVDGATPAASWRMSPSRQVRGLTILGSLAVAFVLLVLALFSVVSFSLVLLPVLGFVLAVLWLRAGVQGEIAARARLRAARRRTTSAPAGARDGATGRGPSARAAGARPDARTSAASDRTQGAAASSAEPTSDAVARSEAVAANEHDDRPFDVASALGPDLAAPAAQSAGDRTPRMTPILDEDDMPLTWDPIPVPRPTYTLKAKAERSGSTAAAASSETHAASGDASATAAPVAATAGGDTAYEIDDTRQAANS